MKKIFLWIFALIWVWICSFTNALDLTNFEFVYSWTVEQWATTSKNIYDFTTTNVWELVCAVWEFVDYTTKWSANYLYIWNSSLAWTIWSIRVLWRMTIFQNHFEVCAINFENKKFYFWSSATFTSDFSWMSYSIYKYTPTQWWNNNCDYSEYEQTISTLSWNLATCNSNINTLSWSLATCQTNLTTCQNSNTCNPTWTCTVNNKLEGNIIYSWTVNLNSSSYTNIFNYWNNWEWTYCVKLTSTNPQKLSFWFANWWTTAPSNLYWLYADQYNNRVCLYWNKAYFNAKLNENSNTVNYEVYKLTDLLNDNIPCEENNTSCDYSEYEQTISTLSWNLATCEWLYNSCDINYNSCTEELNLCMSWAVSWSWTQRSALFINNIQHIWAWIINLTIPEEINRNYEYVNEELDIDIVWYNVDEEYITNIIQKEKLTPTKEDFAYLIENLGWYIPLLCVAWLVIYAWYIIRKVF